jgi:hypothetical protein
VCRQGFVTTGGQALEIPYHRRVMRWRVNEAGYEVPAGHSDKPCRGGAEEEAHGG